ncbi:GNAT family acetyltransferase [Acinetobacter rathckeae]|uniref:GNAT family acetyltransferase n=1 Tax=Acinetobacter rathckeae TaxID=2605272 RepID=UPI0018A2B885|nr:GNAT family acetyltransferase [Acinetobacter rathckeae]MBF7688682.1 GNAT family acetyltransferase [Acinetobacter rathckeae]MBF7696075.1 GNAT family acetyltransferase [Acinetobacter rathckeae]
MFIIRPTEDKDLDPILELWESCGITRPWNHPETDFFRKMAQKDNLFLVAEKDNTVIGSIMGGYDGHRGWIHYLAVHPNHQRIGIATALMQNIERRLIAVGCPKVQLMVRADNTSVIDFYEQLDFEKIESVSLGKRLIKD